MTTQQQPWQSDTTSFADGDAFNHLSDPWPSTRQQQNQNKSRILDCQTCSSRTLWQNVLQVLWEPHTNIFISYHTSAPRAEPGVLHHWHQTPASATLPLTLLNCCSPCPLHRASSHISCSCSSPNPPLEAALAQCTVTMLIQIYLSNSPAAPGWGSVEGPLWPHCCSVPLLLLFLSFISLLFLLLSSLLWYQIPLTAPCKASTATSSVPEGSCTAWAEPHWLQQCPAANSIA